MSGPLRILFVDDAERDALQVRRAFEAAGVPAELRRVDDAAAARIALATGDWDAVIANHGGATGDGVAVLRVLRERGTDIPCLIIAGDGDHSVGECMLAGARDCFRKSDLSALPAAVQRHVPGSAECSDTPPLRPRATMDPVALVKAIPDHVYRLGRDGVILDYRPAEGSTVAAETYIGKHITEVLPPSAAAATMEAIGRAYAGGRTQKLEFTVAEDGEDHEYELRLLAAGADEVLAVARDLSGPRRLQRQLWQVQKMESIARLSGGIAHDFNNILTVIASYIGFVVDDLGPEHASYEDAQVIREAVRKGAALTRQLLAFSRRQVMEVESLDLNEILENMEKILRRVIGEDIELVIDCAAEPWPVKGDRGQMDQIMMNLAVNARDAMPVGGRLQLATANVELGEDNAFRARPGDYVELTVADTGMGMPPDVLAQLFEPFFTTKDPGKGTGLGLATVYGIVKQCGGEIAVTSRVGRGTTFRICLPRADVQAQQRPLSALLPVVRPRGVRVILLVEDEELVRRAMMRVLKRQGYEALEAAGGDEALALCRARPVIDLLISDVVLPGIGGRKLAEKLVELRPTMQVLFVSGYTDETISQQDLEGVAVMLKPFTASQLVLKVRELLGD